MLDIKFLRENPEAVKENIRKKFQDSKLPLVDEVIALDKQLRQHLVDADFRREPLHLGGIGRLLEDPLAFFAHITQRYENNFVFLRHYGRI